MSDASTPLPTTSADLVAALYADLKRMAHFERRAHGAGETLQTTALIHETYLKLKDVQGWNDHKHFLRAAAQAMRMVLVDAVRARLADKRGAGAPMLTLSHAEEVPLTSDDQLLQVADALARLQALDERLARIVECRFFAGYTEPQTAEALGMSERSVRRDWVKAKAWLTVQLAA